jgi:hypothetical protein
MDNIDELVIDIRIRPKFVNKARVMPFLPEQKLAFAVITAAVEDLFSLPPEYDNQVDYIKMFTYWREGYESAYNMLTNKKWRPSLKLWCDLIDWDVSYIYEKVEEMNRVRSPAVQAEAIRVATIHYERLQCGAEQVLALKKAIRREKVLK